MDNLKRYLDDLTAKIDEAETEQGATQLMDDLFEIQQFLEKLRHMLPVGKDYTAALDDDLEHYSALAKDESKRAGEVAEEIYKDLNDPYGTYEEQQRRDYYDSR